MNSVWLAVFVKAAVVLTGAAVLDGILRRSAAATRHLLWLAAVTVLALLPLTAVLPSHPAVAVIRIPAAATRVADGAAFRIPLFEIWAAGAGLLLLRLAVSAASGVSALRSAWPSGVYKGYQVRTSDRISSPLAWSFGRGTILVPSCFDQWPANEQEAALRHEAAHLDRADSQALLVAELVKAAYWLNPLIWYAAYRLRVEQERSADDAAITSGIPAMDYATQLVAIARTGSGAPLFAAANSPGMLTQRIRKILDPRRRRTVRSRRMLLAASVCVLAAIIPLAAMQAEGKIYKIGADVTAPKLIEKIEPSYTQEARDAKIEGGVVLSIVIEADGSVSNIVVKRGLDPGLDANAIEALTKWRFKPAEREGKPVRVSAAVEVNFRLI